MEYEFNKGMDKSAEFYGLKNQYVFLAAGGALLILLITIILLATGVFVLYVFLFTIISTGTLLSGCIWLNKHMGANGLIKSIVKKQTPQFLTNRITCKRLMINKKTEKK
jgi:hypothetical protein